MGSIGQFFRNNFANDITKTNWPIIIRFFLKILFWG